MKGVASALRSLWIVCVMLWCQYSTTLLPIFVFSFFLRLFLNCSLRLRWHVIHIPFRIEHCTITYSLAPSMNRNLYTHCNSLSCLYGQETLNVYQLDYLKVFPFGSFHMQSWYTDHFCFTMPHKASTELQPKIMAGIHDSSFGYWLSFFPLEPATGFFLRGNEKKRKMIHKDASYFRSNGHVGRRIRQIWEDMRKSSHVHLK